MRILDKYIYKELGQTFAAVLIVLLLITFGSEATQLLTHAIEGKIPSSVVFQVLLLKIPPALEIILPLVALLAVMLAIGRFYQDQEMVVLQSCAITPKYFQKRISHFLIPVALFTALISLYVTPWAYQKERVIIAEAQTISPVAGLVAGKFNPLPNNQGVLYAKTIEDGQMRNVWLQLKSPQMDMVLSAPLGRFEWRDNRVILVLENGQSYRGLHGINLASAFNPEANSLSAEVSIQKFARYEGVLPALTPIASRPELLESSTLSLWHAATNEAQALLQWRLVTPIGVLILGLIGLKLSKTGPREGRFAKIFIALLVYILYNQFLVMGRDAIGNGGWPAWLGLWPVVLVFAMLAFTDHSGEHAWWRLRRLRPGSRL